ncbi:hypothetical protein LIER_19656 [Lithospermum erythrorhizon]|uniref:MULE transposase domain-containing protein n=1 Tax=Lithospermum erythrorhizon TaxID=34254 RepID=A0AAV3QMU5_LITER
MHAEVYDDFFTVKVHVLGEFKLYPTLVYEGGTTIDIDWLNLNLFDLKEVDEFSLRSGYDVGSRLFYAYKEPEMELISKDDKLGETNWIVKRVIKNHNGCPDMKIRLCNSTYLAKVLEGKFRLLSELDLVTVQVIGLDRCHTKGLYKQQILCAVALDNNNGYWPLAWIVVEKETTDSWRWFMLTLKQDLGGMEDPSQYVLISDKQRGLEHEMFPLLGCK